MWGRKKNLTLQILYLRFTEISSPGAYLSRIMTLVIQLAVLNCGQIEMLILQARFFPKNFCMSMYGFFFRMSYAMSKTYPITDLNRTKDIEERRLAAKFNKSE